METPLAVSMGDPAGIGIEICVKAWRARPGRPFYLAADVGAVRAAVPDGAFEAIDDPADAAGCFARALPVLHAPLARPVTPGTPDPENAAAIIQSIKTCVGHVLEGRAAAIVTLPIAKASLYESGFAFPGHTEFLADLTADAPLAGERGPVMMLAAPVLRVALASIHAPLSAVPDRITTASLVRVGRTTLQALRADFGIEAPRLAVCGLNPHAGESGAIGREEIEIINPAAATLRAEGWDVTDALPADSLFHADARRGYDAVLAMYHDQGLIPLKTLDFWGGVNVTLGLPIVRTSPDHGVGFDIAGRGVARADSLIAAMALASDIADRRKAR